MDRQDYPEGFEKPSDDALRMVNHESSDEDNEYIATRSQNIAELKDHLLKLAFPQLSSKVSESFYYNLLSILVTFYSSRTFLKMEFSRLVVQSAGTAGNHLERCVNAQYMCLYWSNIYFKFLFLFSFFFFVQQSQPVRRSVRLQKGKSNDQQGKSNDKTEKPHEQEPQHTQSSVSAEVSVSEPQEQVHKVDEITAESQLSHPYGVSQTLPTYGFQKPQDTQPSVSAEVSGQEKVKKVDEMTAEFKFSHLFGDSETFPTYGFQNGKKQSVAPVSKSKLLDTEFLLFTSRK